MAWRGELPPISTSLLAPRSGMEPVLDGIERTPVRWQASQQPIKRTLVIPQGPDGYSGDLRLYPVTGPTRRSLGIR
jgi:hypothetical protein